MSDSERDPLDVLGEQFLQRVRAGERPDVARFAAAHPEHEAALLDLLPTLLMLEGIKQDRESTAGRRVQLPKLERLGDFRILREVGRGGMGVVFEAVQESLDRHVALKVLPQSALLSQNQLARFLREAQTAAKLHHSNIVPVFGSGESDGYHWYAMQFIDGQSLDRWMQQQAAAPLTGSAAFRARARFVATIGAQAAAALYYAHQQGTLHRDIKPANLLLDRSDQVWVTDFGLAKALEQEGLTHSGDVLGTLQYMAPEQFTGHYDARSEVYALGVTLYELLALQPAFAARTRSELVELIRTQRPERLRRRCPDVPEDLVVIVERAMAYDPADRYQDAHALWADLQAFLEDRPIAARRQSTAAVLWRWCRRNRAVAALTASTALALLAAAIVGWTAYVATDDALGKARESARIASEQSSLVERNLRLSLQAFGELFDAVVGKDPALASVEDPDTGEETLVARVVDASDVVLLQQLLAFYDQFTAQNAGSQLLRRETARAYRRVGAIQARLGDLDAAAAAYQQALERYREVNDRDGNRELAALHNELGQLEQRRGLGREAVQRHRLALQLLESDAGSDRAVVRFERAMTHYLLARATTFRGGPGGPGGGPGVGPGAGPTGRPGGADLRDFERVRQESRASLDAARELLTRLQQEDPDNPEYRALGARCLLLAARQAPRREPQETGFSTEEQQALKIFRDLVAQHPAADAYRFELCEALLNEPRRRGPAARMRDEDVAALHEAKEHARVLLERQPSFSEYQALYARTCSLLGARLLRRSELPGESASARELRVAAEVELRAALDIERRLVQKDGAEPRFVANCVLTHVLLGQLLAATGRVAEARGQVQAVVELIRRQQGSGARPRAPLADGRVFELLDALARQTDQLPLLRELRDPREPRPGGDRAQQPRRGR